MMHYQAIATDYDGTLASDGSVSDSTWAAIAAFRHQGGQLILVTGREFEDLQQVCPHLGRFNAVIAENGGVVYWPTSGEVVLRGAPPPTEFVEQLRRSGVDAIHQGRVVMGTWQPHSDVVERTIADMQLNYQVILNKRAVMVLPIGVDKAATLIHVLQALNIAPEQTVGIGDAENDMALLQCCGLGVAVGNALAALKAIADHVTEGDRGEGVEELIHKLLNQQFR